MKPVFVCSAYGGSIDNLELAQKYCKYVLLNDAAPFAPHLIYPQFLDDGSTDERLLGIEAGLVFLGRCEEIWVFTVNGLITSGMRKEVGYADAYGIVIRAFDVTGNTITELKDLPGQILAVINVDKIQRSMEEVEELLKKGFNYESVMKGLDFLMPDQTEPDEKLDEQWENYHRSED